MGKYENDAKQLLHAIGGQENIQSVTHCVTRMRFVLCNPNQADIKAIEKLPSTKGTFTQSGQFQVIIGQDVSLFYNDFIKVSGIVEQQPLENDSKQQTIFQKIMAGIGDIFAPLIPALICGGLVLGLSHYMSSIACFENRTKTLVEISSFCDELNAIFLLASHAIFQLLPVAIIWSITKKMKTTQILGIVLGLTLVSPQLFDYFQLSQQINYQGQVIPAVFAGFILVYLERFWRKVSPEAISIIIVPLFSLIPALFLTLKIAGPMGYIIGDYLAKIVWTSLTCPYNWLIAGIFGLVYALLVKTGLHHFTIILDVQLASSFGGTLLWPILALANIAQGSATLAMAFIQRKNEKAKKIAIPASISCYLGVSEPALFGVNLKYRFPFICGMIGSMVSAMISVMTHTTATSIGVGGIPGILSILPQYVLSFLLAMLSAIMIPFVLTIIAGKKKLTQEELYGEMKTNEDNLLYQKLSSPVEGELILLENVTDQVFSQKLMGDGFAVDLTDSLVVSPFDGEIIMTFPTKHAYGLKRDDGLELLIHIGMDTVSLNGHGFECFVEKGQHIKKGDIIAKVDLDYIKQMNKSLVSPIIITSKHKINLLKTQGQILFNEDILKIEGEEYV